MTPRLAWVFFCRSCLLLAVIVVVLIRERKKLVLEILQFSYIGLGGKCFFLYIWVENKMGGGRVGMDGI
jgi:hypothetical protein